MSPALKELMDDAAAEVVTGRRIDTAAVREGATRRRDRLRTLGTALMLTAAAVLAALVTLPIFATLSVAPASDGRSGLPDRWYYAPVSAPTVRTWHMPAASMVLRGPDRTQWTLVSADTTRYARLPGRDVQQVALSDDGRKVAWVARDGDRLTLTELTLADGKSRSQRVILSTGAGIVALAFDGDAVRLFGEQKNGADFERTATFDGDRLAVTETGVGVRRASGEVVDPGGTRSARAQGVDGRFYVGTELLQSTALRKPGRALPKEVTAVDLLAWAPGGIVMRLDYTSSSERRSSVALMNPDTGELHAVSRPGEGTSTPVTVAPDVVGAGQPVKAAPPAFPRWNADRIRYVLGSYWGNLYSSHRWTVLSGGAALTALLLLAGVACVAATPRPRA
ncbi:hypothetical protein ACIB24_04410 [Spongisporangium articulatum]|uniref:WD40 repeat domain-containing protein n=1 Tax=Spongisporangium articulatum TaxID=3362603 RepID=A0ABW8AKY0_9ACTN